MSKNTLIQFAVPGIAALLAFAVAMGSPEGKRVYAGMPAADDATPYSADHARIPGSADSEPAPTF